MMLAEQVSLMTLGAIAGVAYVVLLWVALAFYVVRDARQRSLSLSFQLFATLLGFIPPFFGALVYFMVRPPHTLDEERALILEEQALIDPEADERQPRPCPSCGREVESDFILCPYCRTQFARRCEGCAHHLRLGWAVCPYCGVDVGVGVQALGRTPKAAGR